MELMKTNEKASEKKSVQPKKKGVLKKLDPEAAKLLQGLKDKANRKSFGRKVKDNEIITLALSQITASHLETLQQQTLTAKDRLQQAFEGFQKSNGKATMDEFIAKLLMVEN